MGLISGPRPLGCLRSVRGLCWVAKNLPCVGYSAAAFTLLHKPPPHDVLLFLLKGERSHFSPAPSKACLMQERAPRSRFGHTQALPRSLRSGAAARADWGLGLNRSRRPS